MRTSGSRATSIVLLLLCMMYLITDVDRVNVSTAVLAFRIELKLSNVQYGWIFSAVAYSYAVFQVSAVAAIVSPTVFGYVVDLSGSWVLPFAGSIGLLLVGAVLTIWLRPDRAIEDAPAAAQIQAA